MADLPIWEDPETGAAYRLRDKLVEELKRDSTVWEPLSAQRLLWFARDSELWKWLRKSGIKRDSPSPKEEERPTYQVKLRLASTDAAALKRVARFMRLTNSEAVATLVRRELAVLEAKRKRALQETAERLEAAEAAAEEPSPHAEGPEDRGSLLRGR